MRTTNFLIAVLAMALLAGVAAAQRAAFVAVNSNGTVVEASRQGLFGRRTLAVTTGNSFYTRPQSVAITQSQLLVDPRHRTQLNQQNSFRGFYTPTNTVANIRFSTSGSCYTNSANLTSGNQCGQGAIRTTEYLRDPAPVAAPPVARVEVPAPLAQEGYQCQRAANIVQQSTSSLIYNQPSRIIRQEVRTQQYTAPAPIIRQEIRTERYVAPLRQQNILFLESRGVYRQRQLVSNGYRTPVRSFLFGRADYPTPVRNFLFGYR